MNIRGERFFILLIALLIFMIIRPFFLGFTFGSMVLDAFMVIVFLFCVNAISERRGIVLIALGLFVAATAFKALIHLNSNLAGNTFILTAMYSFSIVFLVLTAILVLSYVLKDGEVTRDRIAAALCVYLLLGIIWAQAYSLMMTIDPDSFILSNAPTVTKTGLGSSAFDAYYFSFVTLTTLGYGDITPVHPVVRAFATLEAVIGPLYLAILIARLVGLHIAQKNGKTE
jgi:hypothetical protein